MSFVSFHLSFIQPLAPVLLSSNIPGQPNTQKPSREVTRVLTLNGFTALGWCGPRAVEWPLDWSLHQRLGCKELHIHLSHMWVPYASSLYLHGTVLGHMVLLLRFAHIPITSVLGAYWVPGARCQMPGSVAVESQKTLCTEGFHTCFIVLWPDSFSLFLNKQSHIFICMGPYQLCGWSCWALC